MMNFLGKPLLKRLALVQVHVLSSRICGCLGRIRAYNNRLDRSRFIERVSMQFSLHLGSFLSVPTHH